MSTPCERTLPTTPVRDAVCSLIPELQYLSVDTRAIDALAADLSGETFPLPEWRAPVFPDVETGTVSQQDLVDFLFVGNAINFQFRHFESGEKFTTTYDGDEWSGAFGMWACLKREFDDNPAILRGETLAELSLEEVDALFESVDSRSMPMIRERHEILTQIGERLEAGYQGRFANLVERAEPRLFAQGEGIIEHLVESFPSFQDQGHVALRDGTPLTIPFWKRAQLAAGMAYGSFQREGYFHLEDPGSFTIFVDYNLPNVLRGLDVLEFSPHLAELVDSRTAIEQGSREEVELRAATVYAADELMKRIQNDSGSPIYGPQMDYKLFSLRDCTDAPVHLTKTTAY